MKVSHKTIMLAAVAALGVWAASTLGDARQSGSGAFQLSRDGDLYTLKADEAPLQQVLAELRTLAGLSLNVDSRVDAKITAQLENAPIEKVLETLTRSRALVYERDDQDQLRLTRAVVTSEQDPVEPAAVTPDLPARRGSDALGHGVLTNTRRPIGELRVRGARSILLRNAVIDTEAMQKGEGLAIPPDLRAAADTVNYIVQFDKAPGPAEQEALANAGARISHYVPNDAYAVRIEGAAADKLLALPGVAMVEPFHPYFKLSGDVLSYLRGEAEGEVLDRIKSGRFNVMSFRGAELESIIRGTGATVVQSQRVDDREVLTVEIKPEQLAQFAANDDVQWLEPAQPRMAMNDLADRKLRASALKSLHPNLRGAGVTVGVTDSGVDFRHLAFSLDPAQPTSTGLNSRIVSYETRPGGFTSDGLPGDTDGHGTHVSGSILGNGALSQTALKVPGSGTAPFTTNQFAGIAPEARLVMIEDFNSFSDQEQADLTYTKGGRLSNNSWGANVFEYGTASALWDALVRDATTNEIGNQELIAFFAAGNAGGGAFDGTGGAAGSVGQPGNAKNVITVGAVEQPRYADNIDGLLVGEGQIYDSRDDTDSDWQIAQFSSRGPVTPTDPRVKPDIVAPGVYAISVQSRETNPDEIFSQLETDYRANNVNTGTNYAFLSGTSMATPIAAGAGALLYEFYTNRFGVAPSPAMMKAMMVGGARFLNSLIYKYTPFGNEPAIVYQGWGMLDVVRSAEGPRMRTTDLHELLDQGQTTPLLTGQIYSRQVTVAPGEGGLRIVLAWTDKPGTPGNDPQLVNDLDLVVLGTGGGYLGNYFSGNGRFSYRIDNLNQAIVNGFGDGFNNVEVVYIPHAPAGTYTIQVYGFNVPQGPQDFALNIMKGVGFEGRTKGEFPSVALDSNDAPVIAYATVGDEQPIVNRRNIFVKRWIGNYGDPSDLGGWRRLDDQWADMRDSARYSGISRTIEESSEPSVAVRGKDIFVSWTESDLNSTSIPSRIYLRQYDGSDWAQLAGSGQDNGVSANTTYSASKSVVAVWTNGQPIVAWRQANLTGAKIHVTTFDGTNWIGFAGSHTNGVPGGSVAVNPDMIVDSLGRIVVAWEEQTTQRVQVRRWNGTTWTDLGAAGNAPYAGSPKLAAGGVGDFFLSWIQTPDGVGTNFYFQIYAARYNGSFVGMGTSATAPSGVSGSTNNATRPVAHSIGVRAGAFVTNVVVAWQSGTNPINSILVRQYNGSTWSGVAGADLPPGVALNGGLSTLPDMVVDTKGLPFIAFQNDTSGTNKEVMVYTVIGDREPPAFDGLLSAVSGTNNNVVLSWLPAVDNISTTIIYRIFRGTQTFACGVSPSCDEGNVFSNLIATVTNVTTFTVTNLTANLVYCFGVRAADTNGLMDGNTIVRSAGPVSGVGDNDSDCLANALEIAAGTEPCLRDTDADGMWDGWEWTYSTNNPSKTNSISVSNTNKVYLSPIDNGNDNVRTLAQGDGDPMQFAAADLDGDGASNFEEFQWWFQFTMSNGLAACEAGSPTNRIGPDPTRYDTDGDGMPDGWEIINGLNPTIDDSGSDLDGDGVTNGDEYLNGGDPRSADSDGDGLTDGAEILNGTLLNVADSDGDGLDDGFEVAIGSNPRNADSNNSFLPDAAVFELGLSPTGTPANFNIQLHETFEAASPTLAAWTNYAPNAAMPFSFWHLSYTEPQTNLTGVTNGIIRFDAHSPTGSYRAARDPSRVNLNTNYSGFGSLAMALQAPTITNSATLANLFVSWMEWYETEPNADFCVLQARSGSNTNWINVSSTASGRSGITNVNEQGSPIWVRRGADISVFAGQPNVQIRFLFTANAINNQYKGWYVDDVRVYEAVTLSGWVRDINGRAIEGATVRALGRGGVTNVVGGHAYVRSGRRMGEAMTAADGSYRITGLPAGNYYIKAEAASHIAEFYDGPLFTGVYAFAAGFRPGVPDREQVTTNGILAHLTIGSTAEVHFELERGSGVGRLGVAAAGAPVVTVNNQTAQRWNGSTNAPAFENYPAAANLAALLDLQPDWLTNAVAPLLLSDLAYGNHRPYVGTNAAMFPIPDIDVRDGETVRVEFRTNAANGRLYVAASNAASFQIRLNGRLLTNTTPATIPVLAGRHEVGLISTSSSVRIGTKTVVVPPADRLNVIFNTNDLFGAPGSVLVRTVDINGNTVSGLAIRVNGTLVSSNEVAAGSPPTTPVLLTQLRPGLHLLSVSGEGFKNSELRTVTIVSGVTNSQTFIVYEADRDHDRVGDTTEILGYTNVFLFHRDDDPDGDALSNRAEFDLFRIFNVRVNPFVTDTDGDGLADGFEVGYNGISNSMALSVLATNTLQFANSVKMFFVGRYLDGIDYFGTGAVAASIDGDRFVGTVSHPLVAVPTKDPALMVFTNIAAFPSNIAVNIGQNAGVLVFADGRPDVADTDGDGMWDGYEYTHGLATSAKLDLIERARAEEDPDADGLTNLREFMGVNNLADLLDSSNPNLADSDGDFIPDGWEYTYGFDPNDPLDAFSDPDGDNLVNLGEYLSGTNPKLSDTDADFLPDFEEVAIYMSDPLDTDTDNDGLLDGQEVWDKDMDGIQDGGFFPMWAGGDLDGDGLVDGPTDWDTDGDGMPDGFEVLDRSGNIRPEGATLNPYDPTDGDEDADGDGLTNLQEFLIRDSLFGNNPSDFGLPGVIWDYSSDPFNGDTDGDALPDGFEAYFGLHPVDPIPALGGDSLLTRYVTLGPGGDPDGDGLWNLREYNIRFHLNPDAPASEITSFSTHPWNPDTDGDGLGDGEEDRAFRSHPIEQDADGDRLTDGTSLTGKWGEVESDLRENQYVLIVTNTTWEAADAAARISHAEYFGSTYSNIIGHLAVFSDPFEFFTVFPGIGVSDTNVAIGASNPGTGEEDWSWQTGEFFFFDDLLFTFGDAASSYVAGVVNHLTVDSSGAFAAVTNFQEVTGYIIEWENAPVVTNHYDQAVNDLWQLVWPADPENNLPFWRQVIPDTNQPAPEARWGAALSYVPVFETKNPRNDNTGTILLDNRQLVLIGGRDGVSRHKDVWEFVIRSNSWIRSSQPLNGLPPGYTDGLSEMQAIPVFGYKNTKDDGCSCDNIECDGTEFGLPKNRPWSGGSEGGESRSFDWTFLFGGWSEQHVYDLGHIFYKSKDDPRPITESQGASQGVTELINESGNLTAVPQVDGAVRTFLIGTPPFPLALDGDDANDAATGYSAIQYDAFALRPGCDDIESAVMELRIESQPSGVVTARVIAEISRSLGHSDPEYASDLDTREPSVRLTSGSYFTSVSVADLVIYPTSEVASVDVTELVREVIGFGGGGFSTAWDASIIGFVFDATAHPEYAVIRTAQSKITVTYTPSYKVDAQWEFSGGSTEYTSQPVSARKSAGLAYDYDQDRLVLFGGIDGNTVLGDTHVGEMKFSGDFSPQTVDWVQKTATPGPPARWGHSTVYDAKNKRVVVFGGFDARHRPLNDLWFYSVENDQWTEFTSYRDDQIPQPRGGASLVYYGDYDYDRAIADYCVGGNKQKLVLFGGTDGKSYFNDTWVFDDTQGRWILASPVGEQSISPPPRAFASMVFAQNGRTTPDLAGGGTYRDSASPPCATAVAFLFGGRIGALPTGRDTDQDLVDDGTEHELGGPPAGRDPRINALIVSNGVETIPYTFKRIGSIRGLGDPTTRGVIANFESLRHDRPDAEHASLYDIPYEGHVDQWSLVSYGPGIVGVDAMTPEFTRLWYHRHGIGDPFDARDKWQLGRPDNSALGTNGAPPYAYSGRWVYGTDLKGSYPNNAIMELYAPLLDFTVPPTDSTDGDNAGSYFLVFHEWLDLADSNDVVRIDAVRPETPADINTRVTGLNRPVKPVLPNRNNLQNTSGKWRRVIVPLDILANDTNVYLRFTLQSDGANARAAGGWYIDDVAILQAHDISGGIDGLAEGTEVCLIGENFNEQIQQCTQLDPNGNFQFGLLPLGNYQLVSPLGTNGPIILAGPGVSTNISAGFLPPEFTGISMNSPLIIRWAATNGAAYRLDYTTNLLSDSDWNNLYTVTSTANSTLSYTDPVSTIYRIYRVSITNAP